MMYSVQVDCVICRHIQCALHFIVFDNALNFSIVFFPFEKTQPLRASIKRISIGFLQFFPCLFGNKAIYASIALAMINKDHS